MRKPSSTRSAWRAKRALSAGSAAAPPRPSPHASPHARNTRGNGSSSYCPTPVNGICRRRCLNIRVLFFLFARRERTKEKRGWLPPAGRVGRAACWRSRANAASPLRSAAALHIRGKWGSLPHHVAHAGWRLNGRPASLLLGLFPGHEVERDRFGLSRRQSGAFFELVHFRCKPGTNAILPLAQVGELKSPFGICLSFRFERISLSLGRILLLVLRADWVVGDCASVPSLAERPLA